MKKILAFMSSVFAVIVGAQAIAKPSVQLDSMNHLPILSPDVESTDPPGND